MKLFFSGCAVGLCSLLCAASPVIPEEIYAVEGKECSVYFANLAMNGGVPGEIEVFSKVGRQDAKRWRFVPEAKHAGKSFPLKIEWKAPDGKTLATCESVVKVAPPVGEKRSITIMLCGSSSTDGTFYPRQLADRLKADGYTVKFIGTHIGGGKPAVKPDDILAEGRGGWRYRDYASRWNDDPHYKKGKSPFLSGPGKFDYQDYLNRVNGGKAPDFITIYLGGNDIASATDETVQRYLDDAAAAFDEVITGFRKAAPEVKIGIVLSAPPAGQDAFGANYGTVIRRAQYCRNLEKFWGMLEKKCKQYSGVTPIPVSVGVDTENHYPSRMEPVSDGSRVMVRRQTNALHPTLDGNQK